MIPSNISIRWIRGLAEPYLRGYRAVRETRGRLRGYWFLAGPGPKAARVASDTAKRVGSGKSVRGFFVGYLLRREACACLDPLPPECLVFVFVEPVGGAAHRRLVRDEGSLVRKTFNYIRLLTHRPPRFEFYPAQRAAMVRHQTMRGWPRGKWRHFSGNFFIETLAWLVRSALVKKLSAWPESMQT